MKIQTKARLSKALPSAGHKLIAKASKNSPHILFGFGVVSILGGTVLACKATLKTHRQLDEFKAEIEGVKSDLGETEGFQRDLSYVYGKNTLKIVGNFGPAIVVTTVGVLCITGSHVQLTKRNNALMAAYTAVHTAYENYRNKVREVYGEDKEMEIYHGVELEQLTDDEGRSHDVVVSDDPTKMSPYARFFDEGSKHWQKEAELNRYWIECQQTYLNQLLRGRGYVFLNEAYEALGIEWSSAGQAVGWFLDRSGNGEGDNYIDFNLHHPRNRRFINGIEPCILLDFNVDGTIIDKI